MAVSDQNLIWVDMEMTGLIPEEHRVIEIATIVTDSNLTVLAEGPVLAITRTLLRSMPWMSGIREPTRARASLIGCARAPSPSTPRPKRRSLF